jgi:hypothetical protein
MNKDKEVNKNLVKVGVGRWNVLSQSAQSPRQPRVRRGLDAGGAG